MKCINVLSYLHSVVHGRDSVYTAFADGVGAHPDVLLQLIQVGELGRAAVHLEAGRFARSSDPLTRQHNGENCFVFIFVAVSVQHTCSI